MPTKAQLQQQLASCQALNTALKETIADRDLRIGILETQVAVLEAKIADLEGSGGSSFYTGRTLLHADYGEANLPMKVTAYDPMNQVVPVAERCIYPRFDGAHSEWGREFRLDKDHIDPYDLSANNGSNRTQLVNNSLDNTFAAFLPGEHKQTAFVVELMGQGLSKMGALGGGYSQIMQWKSLRLGGGSDPFLALGEADDGFELRYNSVQYWNSAGQPDRGRKVVYGTLGNFKQRQIKLVLDAVFSSGSDGGFRLLGEPTSDPTKPLTELVPWVPLPTLSPGSPGSTVSWGPYQETWLPSITRRYWDVEVLA